jgi:hypothetical protein
MSDMVKVCPNCGSRNIRVEMTPSIAFGAPSQYRCENCEFMSYIFPDVEREKAKKIKVKDAEKAVNKAEKIDTNFGRFVFKGTKIWWKYVGPVIALWLVYLAYVTNAASNQGGLYASLLLFSLTSFAILISYLIPDRMSLWQSRFFGLFIILISTASGSLGFYVLSPFF